MWYIPICSKFSDENALSSVCAETFLEMNKLILASVTISNWFKITYCQNYSCLNGAQIKGIVSRDFEWLEIVLMN